MSRRRIAYYLVTAGFGGGMEINFLELLERLDRAAFEPLVYFRCGSPEGDRRLRREFARLDIPVREVDEEGVPLPGAAATDRRPVHPAAPQDPISVAERTGQTRRPSAAQSAWYSWQSARAAASVFQRDAIDIIHFLHGWYPSLELPLIASRLAKIPVRISDVLLEPHDISQKRLVHKGVIQLAVSSATRVRAMYPRMQEQIRRFHIPRRRITVVPNWVNLDAFTQVNGAHQLREELGIPLQRRVVSVPARLSEEKGHRVLIEAMAKLGSAHPEARVLFAGDGPLKDALRRQVASLGLGDRVLFLGFRSDMPRVLGSSDIVALPSFTEGLPGALLEAMAAGKPILATDVGGVSDLFRAGNEIGRLVPPGDVNALGRAMEELLSLDDAALRRMGANARAVIRQEYAPQRAVERMIALYGEDHA